MNPAPQHSRDGAALRGASLAFQRSPGVTSPIHSEVTTNRSGASATDGDSSGYQAARAHPGRLDPKNPSFIAATLAASRTGSPSGSARVSLTADAVDSESIAPTGNLISLFEGRDGKKGGLQERQKHGKLVRGATPDGDDGRTMALPPAQARSSERISAMPMPKPKLPVQLTSPGPSKPKPPPPREQKPEVSAQKHAKSASKARVRTPSPPSVVSRSTAELLSPKPMRLIKPTLAPPVLSSPQASSPGTSGQEASSPSPDPEKRGRNTNLRPPTPPKPRGSYRAALSGSRRRGNSDTPLSRGSSSTTPLTEFGLPIVSPSPSRPTVRKSTPPPILRRDSVASAPTSPIPISSQRRRLTTTSTSNLTLDPLTSAIMASSLASSRLTPHNTGSSLPPPSLPKRQRSPRLLQTLRQPQSYSDEDPERLKIAHRHKLSSNKHAHHEGSRKRWRDQITQRERKRYEAVWASNRGYLLDDGALQSLDGEVDRVVSECVANVVVRELWKRSRLPGDELIEVWELVDRGDVGMLTRQEFIVGMWLIDQRLRGRKLPVRVSDSVWNSANGVRISKPKAR